MDLQDDDKILDEQTLELQKNEPNYFGSGDESLMNIVLSEGNISRIASATAQRCIYEMFSHPNEVPDVCPSKPRTAPEDTAKDPKGQDERRKKAAKERNSFLNNIATIGLGIPVPAGTASESAVNLTNFATGHPHPQHDQKNQSPLYQSLNDDGTGVLSHIAEAAVTMGHVPQENARTRKEGGIIPGSIDISSSEGMMLLPVQNVAQSDAHFHIPTEQFVRQHTFPVESEISTLGLSVHKEPAQSHIKTLGDQTVTPSVALLDEQRAQQNTGAQPPVQTLFRSGPPEQKNTTLKSVATTKDQLQSGPGTSRPPQTVPQASGGPSPQMHNPPLDAKDSILEQLRTIRQEIKTLNAQVTQANRNPPAPPP